MQAALSHSHSHEHRGNADDAAFLEFRRKMQVRFAERVGDGVPLFTTDAGSLWETYLAAFPAATRQTHNCNACHHFIRRYGGLVTIDEHGNTMPAFWDVDDAPDEYKAAIAQLFLRVRRANVTGVFLSSDTAFGADLYNDTWIHYLLRPRTANVFLSKTLSAPQAIAEKLQDYQTVRRALSEFGLPVLESAVQLLKSDALFRSEKVLGPAEWLLEIASMRRDRRSAFHNLLWRAVATAPAGFCHPRSSMIGTLLEDIEKGLPFKEVERKFRAKMAPTVYQRPQAPPKEGAIQQAEKLVEQLGIARSLERRFARLEEVEAVWVPRREATPIRSDGYFAHLRRGPSSSTMQLQVPPSRISWVKFARDVLPDAKAIEVRVPAHGSFVGLLTAVHADAPPILQWDTEELRNPVSWYLYAGGSTPAQWNLIPGFAKVTAVTRQPNMWHGDRFPNQGKGVFFLVEGARDVRARALGLFPEILKSELHGVRSVIEAHSRTAAATEAEHATACGVAFQPFGGNTGNTVHVRVTSGAVALEYVIDRWE